MRLDLDNLADLARDDRQLGLALGSLTARVRMGPDQAPVDFEIADGAVASVKPAAGEADLVISGSDSFWTDTLAAQPAYEASSLTSGGASFAGDIPRTIAPHYSAWERLLQLMRFCACGLPPMPKSVPDRRETDDAIGRYAYVSARGKEARIYYEVAGQGDVPLLLHATAGADSRQFRHMLSYPPLRARFRMIAYDLPGHGKSLPVLGEPWWEAQYRPGREELMDWAVGLVEALGLDQPVFLGCSVGGQLAIDLAAWRAEHFRAFVSLNGWSSASPGMRAFDNAPFRDPAIASDYFAGRVLATTSPLAPEARRHETAFVYRSNAPGIYAGDNDYFMNAHDLAEDGWRIDTSRTPLFALAGEYDRSSLSPKNGAPAIPRHVKGAVYRTLQGLGHFAPSDDPEAFCKAITPILDEVSAACRARAGE
ncbi:MAG: alpha/beta hydrolase [Novosphingobium sp.]|nr:alpha/beta hydrolase [Novosphingobium sp.]